MCFQTPCIESSIHQILNFVSFLYYPLGSLFNPQLCVSYQKIIYACPWGPREAFGDLLKSKNIPVRAPFLRPHRSRHPVVASYSIKQQLGTPSTSSLLPNHQVATFPSISSQLLYRIVASYSIDQQLATPSTSSQLPHQLVASYPINQQYLATPSTSSQLPHQLVVASPSTRSQLLNQLVASFPINQKLATKPASSQLPQQLGTPSTSSQFPHQLVASFPINQQLVMLILSAVMDMLISSAVTGKLTYHKQAVISCQGKGIKQEEKQV